MEIYQSQRDKALSSLMAVHCIPDGAALSQWDSSEFSVIYSASLFSAHGRDPVIPEKLTYSIYHEFQEGEYLELISFKLEVSALTESCLKREYTFLFGLSIHIPMAFYFLAKHSEKEEIKSKAFASLLAVLGL